VIRAIYRSARTAMPVDLPLVDDIAPGPP